MIRVSGQSKSRPVKAAGAEVGVQQRKQKLHAAVAKSTFGSENVKKTVGPGPLFEVLMSKNCTPLWRKAHLEVKLLKKTVVLGALFEVLMSQNCTPLWRKGHLEVKMFKNCGSGAAF